MRDAFSGVIAARGDWVLLRLHFTSVNTIIFAVEGNDVDFAAPYGKIAREYFVTETDKIFCGEVLGKCAVTAVFGTFHFAPSLSAKYFLKKLFLCAGQRPYSSTAL